MIKTPKISIIMSVYNLEDFLTAAIESILDQTFADFEFIIINDASTDNSEIIIEKFARKDKRIKVITNNQKIGLTKSLNKGIKIACGEYLARMDGDDIALPKRLKRQVEFMKKNKDLAFCGTNVILVDEKGKKLKQKKLPLSSKKIRSQVMHFCPFIHPTLFFRQNVLLSAGKYNENFQFAQDYELILRLLEKFKGANINEPLLYYRVGLNKAISLKNLKKQEYFALKARWLAITKYHYSLLESWKMIKPLLSYLIPFEIKLIFYKKFFWNL